MKFFRLPRPNRQLLDEETPLQKFLRLLVVLLLFGGVVFAFWLNNGRRMERLDMRQKTQPAHSSQDSGKPGCGVPFTWQLLA